jgi:ACS family tartrate transporter-like MFS transporter
MTNIDGDDGAGDADLRRTLARVSWRILPLIGIGYCLAFVDRVNISFAALQMNADLGFSATVYGAGAGVFFLSYAAFEVPSNLLLVRFGARRWLARIMFTWGLLAAGMMFVRTPTQFYIMRFLLGLAEAGFFPGAVYYLSQWFPSAWRARSISRFYIAAPLGSVFMGGLAGALLGLKGTLGLAGWQWLFLLEGLPAVILSFALLRFLPDRPANAPWLQDDEKRRLEGALTTDARGLEAERPPTIVQAALNTPVLALGAMNFLLLAVIYAITFSAPLMISGATHWTPGRVGAVVAIGGVLGAVSMLVAGWLSDRSRDRLMSVAVPLFGAAAVLALMAFDAAPAVLIGGYLAFFAMAYAVLGVFWAALDRLLPRSFAPVAIAAINTIGMIGSFVAPIAWGRARDLSGGYALGLKILPLAMALAGVIALGLRAWAGSRRAPQAVVSGAAG